MPSASEERFHPLEWQPMTTSILSAGSTQIFSTATDPFRSCLLSPCLLQAFDEDFEARRRIEALLSGAEGVFSRWLQGL